MNAIGTQLRDPINSGLTRWRMAVLNKYMDAAAELGRNSVSKHQIHLKYGHEQADAELDYRTVSRYQILRRERGQGNIKILVVPAQLTTINRRIGNHARSIHTLAICATMLTYMHACIHTTANSNSSNK